jgi:hypothetical protein
VGHGDLARSETGQNVGHGDLARSGDRPEHRDVAPPAELFGGRLCFLRDFVSMRNWLGMCLQFAVLAFLPLLIIWQLNFGFPLLWMPALTVAGMVVFWIGHSMRDRV